MGFVSQINFMLYQYVTVLAFYDAQHIKKQESWWYIGFEGNSGVKKVREQGINYDTKK